MTVLAQSAHVLRLFSTDQPTLGVSDLVALLGMPKSSASRLLRAMCEAGLLESTGRSRRYRPGVLLFELGQAYGSGSSLLRQAERVVGDLVEAVGHTGYVSMREGLDVIGLAYRTGRHVLRVGTPIGRRLAVHASATGRSLLARLDDGDVRALFPDGLPPGPPNAPASMDDLLRRLERIRRCGYAESNDEANPGVGALACAVGDPASDEDVSLCITFPAMTITARERAVAIEGLLAGTRGIAGALQDRRCAARLAAP